METEKELSEGGELADLAHHAAALDAGITQDLAPPAQPGQELQTGPDNVGEMKTLLEVVGAMLATVYPNTGKTLQTKAEAMAAAAAPVLDKYGVNLGETFGRYGPEIGFVLVWLPAGLELAGAVRADRALQKEAQERKKAKDAENASNEDEAQAAA